MFSHSSLFNVHAGFAQSLDNAFDNVFKLYVVSDQRAATAREIGFEFEHVIGNLLEDYLRLDFTTQAGIRQELPDGSILGAGYVFNAIPTEVWEDPYVAGRRRKKTDRRASGLRFTYDKILRTNLQVEFTWRKTNVDDELSGRTYLGLPADQAERLDRESNQYQLEVLYAFKFGEKHFLVPAFE